MITPSIPNGPRLHVLCFALLSLLVCLPLGSARAQDEKPNRTREGERTRSGETESQSKEKPKGNDSIKPKEAEGGKKRAAGEGEGAKKGGMRDGGKKSGQRDGESKKTGARDGDVKATGNELVLRVTDGGDTVIVAGERITHQHLRAHLSEFLPEHRGDKVVIEADEDVAEKIVADVLDAARDNGAKGAKLKRASKSDR